jgi:V8-like Glu-specific endopeptidase
MSTRSTVLDNGTLNTNLIQPQFADPLANSTQLYGSSSSSKQVVEYDPYAKQQKILSSNSKNYSDLAIAEKYLSSAGYSGIEDFLGSLGSPSEFFQQLDTPSNSVIGTDDRIRITDTTTYPWGSIGRLEIGFSNGSGGHGSGVMISPYHFLTAGHCVYDSSEGGWASTLKVSPGQNDITKPYGEANWTYARTYTGWTNSSNVGDDWALITLDRNIGNFTGWLGYEWNSSDSYFQNMTVNTAGYPGDLGGGDDMYFASGPIQKVSSSQFFYGGTMDTAPGQSGSPVWRYNSTTGDRYVVGVHAYGSNGDGFNKATRITQEKFNSLESWIGEDNSARRPTDRPDLTDYDDWFNTNFASFSSSQARPGDTLTVRSVIQNNGTANAGNFKVSFYASTNDIISTADYLLGEVNLSSVSALNWSDAIWTGNLPTNLPVGQYYIGWRIDSGNTQSEFREDNNTGVITSSRLTVNAPLPTVTIATTDPNAAEVNTGQTANPGLFTISRTGATNTALTVTYNVGGTATKGSDYNNITNNTTNTGTIVIPVGATSITLPLNVINDTLIESNETVVVSLASNNAYTLGTSKTGTVTIADNDQKPIITIAATDPNAAEVNTGQTANPGLFTITRTGSTNTALTVTYNVGGTAAKGSDYNNITGNTTNTGTVVIPVGATSVTLPINVINDTLIEANETVAIALASSTAYTLGSSTSGTVTIVDNDRPTVSITTTDANAAEVNTGQTANPGLFTITRTGSTTTALTVTYNMGGTATKGSDYNNVTGNTTNTGTVVIPVGATSVTLPINVINDTLSESNETVIVTLASSTGYNLGTNTGTVTIVDNDRPTVSITTTDANAAEVNTGQTPNPGLFTITRTGSTSTALTITYSVGGTATKGSDYNNVTGNTTNTGTVVIPVGATSITLPINVINDTLKESNETVVVSLVSNTAYSLGTSSGTVTIVDNDTVTDPLVGNFTLTGNNDIDSLLASSKTYWNTSNNGGVVTYSFYNNSSGSYYGSETISEVSSAIKSSVRNILATLSSFINVNFVEVADTGSSYGVVRYMFSNGPDYAYAYYPSTDPVGGDVHLNPNFENDPFNQFSGGYGSYGYMALIHETFHALGLKHPGNYNGSGTGEGPFLSPATDNNTNTVMTYNDAGANAVTPMAYDIRALQYLYGARSNNATGTNYVFNTVDRYTAEGQTFGSTTTQVKQAIWDSGGIDTFDFSGLSASTSYRFDLNQGGILTTQSAYNGTYYDDRSGAGLFQTTTFGTAIAFNTVIENLINSRGNDNIIANSAANTFKGYTRGTNTGNDIYDKSDRFDILELTGYSLSDLTTSVSGGNLTVNLGSFGSIRVNNYYGSGGSMRFLIGGNYYRYNTTGGWQIAAAALIPGDTNHTSESIIYSDGWTKKNLSPGDISNVGPVIACQCVVCSATRIVTRIGPSTLIEAIKVA